MAKKKLLKEIKDTMESQFDNEGFDYALTEKISPDSWGDSLPEEIKVEWRHYLKARKGLKDILKEYGVDTF